MRGVEVTNSTDLQLLPGPISVYDGAAYAGDAQVGHVAPGEKRLLAYSVDLDMDTQTKDESSADIRKLKIVNGLIEQTNLNVNKITYQFKNKAKNDRTVVIEHPKLNGYSLTGGLKPTEETQNLYRFELSTSAGKQNAITIAQEFVSSHTLEILGYDLGTMMAYQTQGRVSKPVIDAFKEAQRRQGQINEVQRQLDRQSQERGEIEKDQARARENIKAIDKTTELYQNYIKQFTEQETRLKELTGQSKTAREAIEKLQGEYRAWLTGLNVE
jgi:hypothetical protein